MGYQDGRKAAVYTTADDISALKALARSRATTVSKLLAKLIRDELRREATRAARAVR